MIVEAPRAARAAQPGDRVATPTAFWVVRPARLDDLPAIAALAAMTGGGFVALPDDWAALKVRLERSAESLATPVTAPVDELYMLVLEDAVTGRIGGTASLNSRVGVRSPLYSFKVRTERKSSAALESSTEIVTLEVSRELEGHSEVGGLFLHPQLRTGGLGRLLARSRYMFIAQHRERFGDTVLAELRGWLTADGSSPFWDAVGRRFCPVDFAGAERIRRHHGCQAIVDLLPKLPLCANLLTREARAVLGKTHESGTPALRLLLAEGFNDIGSIDLLEGGPNLVTRTDELTTLRASTLAPLVIGVAGERALACAGRCDEFRAWLGTFDPTAGTVIAPEVARLLNLEAGQVVRHASA